MANALRKNPDLNVYFSEQFVRLAERQGLTDDKICGAVDEMNRGLIEANLGAGLFKKRIAMPGKGKRGSWRTLLGFEKERGAFFLYLFPKNSRGNIEAQELAALKHLSMRPDEIRAALDCGELSEVHCNG